MPPAAGDGPGRALPAAGPPVCLGILGFVANRGELLRRVGLPAGASDAELLLRLYGELGGGAAEAIAGPFAWLVWEPSRRRLVCASDRHGVHAPAYAFAGGAFRLAASVAGLLPRLAPFPGLDRRALAGHLAGEGPPRGGTFFERIAALESGEVLEVEDARRRATRRYWSVAARPVCHGSDAEHAEAFRELLLRVSAEYLPAGAAGVTLSGGLDSTSVTAALCAASHERPPVPFLWTTPELPAADERAGSLAVCARYGLRPVEIRADLLWPLRHRDRPRTDSADPLVPHFDEVWDATFAAARERGLRVLFTGAAGDNLFGGNAFAYPDLLLTGRWGALARQLREHLPHSEIGLARVIRSMVLGPVLRAYLPRRARVPAPAWLGEEGRALLADGFAEEPVPYRLLPGRKLHLRQMRERVLPRITALLGRRAAAHGVELRHPLLDHRLFELAAALPTSQLFRAARRKVVVRNAMRPFLPAEVVERRGKVYPVAIFERGAREREVQKMEALLTGMRAAELGLVDEGKLRAAYRDYRTGASRDAGFWRAVTLEAWLGKRLG
ncbi:MAG TPA: asparagine synthetase B family protein [Thermoanaerobaculia bacterium]